jgi:hypothetical protein
MRSEGEAALIAKILGVILSCIPPFLALLRDAEAKCMGDARLSYVGPI